MWYRVYNIQTGKTVGLFPSKATANRVRLAMGWIRDTKLVRFVGQK